MGLRITKLFLFVFVLACAAGAGELWWNTVMVGNYLATANLFLSILAFAVPVLLVALTIGACVAIARLKVD